MATGKQGNNYSFNNFFLTDNGGSKAMSADNTPLRGFKGSLYEGGIRTPFIVSWPKRFAGGRTINTPVVSLDILPTALDALGIKSLSEHRFDGKSLLPLLTGDSLTHHDTLYWSEGGKSGEWAVRRGDWKLHADKQNLALFDVAKDPSEKHDLAAEQADVVKELSGVFDAWIGQMADPITGDDKRWSQKAPAEVSDREKRRLEKRQKRRLKNYHFQILWSLKLKEKRPFCISVICMHTLSHSIGESLLRLSLQKT